MSRLKIIIVEPDIFQAKEIKMALEIMWAYKVVGIVNSIDSAIQEIDSNNPDLILLNTRLAGNESGFDLAKAIRKENSKVHLIFIAENNDVRTWQKAKSFAPVAYLIKPFVPLTLQATVELSLKRTSPSKKTNEASIAPSSLIKGQQKSLDKELEYSGFKDFLFIKQNQKVNKVELSNILTIESSGNYCYIHTTDKKYVIKRSLQNVRAQLPQNLFIQIHRSFVVQLSYISSIDTSKNLVYVGEKFIPLGRTFKNVLFQQLDFL